jgi:hypothetical protein
VFIYYMLYCLLFLPAVLAVYSDWCEDNKDAEECCASDKTGCEDLYECECPGNLTFMYWFIAIFAAVVCVCLCLFVMFTKYFHKPKENSVKADDYDSDKDEQEQKPLLF